MSAPVMVPPVNHLTRALVSAADAMRDIEVSRDYASLSGAEKAALQTAVNQMADAANTIREILTSRGFN